MYYFTYTSFKRKGIHLLLIFILKLFVSALTGMAKTIYVLTIRSLSSDNNKIITIHFKIAHQNSNYSLCILSSSQKFKLVKIFSYMQH